MNVENNIAAEPVATLSEAELFAEFLTSTVTEFTDRGREIYRHDAEGLLTHSGDYITVDLQLEYVGDEPSFHLELAENELLGMLHNVKLARAAFDEMKARRLVRLDDHAPDASQEEFEEWDKAASEAERNPRYLPFEAVKDPFTYIDGDHFHSVIERLMEIADRNDEETDKAIQFALMDVGRIAPETSRGYYAPSA